MKFFAVLAATAIAFASAAEVPVCNPTQLLAAMGASGAACPVTAIFTATPLALPTGEMLTKFCANDACKKLLADINTALPTDCSVGNVAIKATIVDKFPEACAAAATGASASNSSSNSTAATNANATASAPGANETAETPATESSAVGETSSSSASKSTSEEVTAGPAATAKTPAATTSAASTVAAVTGAVVVAIAAQLL